MEDDGSANIWMPYHLRNMRLSSHLHSYSLVQFKAAKNIKYRKQSSRLMDSFNKYHPSSRCKMEGLWQWQTQTKSSVGPAKASNKISDTNVENVLLICPQHKLDKLANPLARSKTTLSFCTSVSLFLLRWHGCKPFQRDARTEQEASSLFGENIFDSTDCHLFQDVGTSPNGRLSWEPAAPPDASPIHIPEFETKISTNLPCTSLDELDLWDLHFCT